MQSRDRSIKAPAPPSTTLPRLMPRENLDEYETHVQCFGPRPRGGPGLIAEIERAGLRGHGGAGFPTATKIAAVAHRRRRGHVVVNATEGEPMSAKPRILAFAGSTRVASYNKRLVAVAARAAESAGAEVRVID